MNRNKRTILTYLITLLLLVLVVGGAIMATRNHAANKPSSSEQEPLRISDTSSLSNALLDKQFNAVYFALSLFIQNKISPDIRGAVVVGDVRIQPDGLIIFNVRTGAPKIVSFDVKLDRSAFDKVQMTIPAYNFDQTLSVY